MKGFAHAAGYHLVRELSITPDYLVNEFEGADKLLFRMLYAGRIAKSIYRLYELEA